MRSESIFIFLISLAITIGIVSATYYFTVVRQPAPKTSIEQPPVGGTPSASTPVQDDRSDQIIKCHDPKLGEFYTNATSCDKADLNQRLSMAQSTNVGKPQPTKAKLANANAQQTSNTTQIRTKPNLRSPAKSPPDGLSAECRFPVGEAAELERRMAGSRDPSESMWRDDYCEWRVEVSKLGCELPSDFFYYSYFELCS